MRVENKRNLKNYQNLALRQFGKKIVSIDCVILCGGKSSRLKGTNGESKALLPFGDKSLVAHNFDKMLKIFKRVFIACKENQVELIRKSLDCHDLPKASLTMTKEVDCHDSTQCVESHKTRQSRSFFSNDGVGSDIFIIESPEIFAPIIGIANALSQLQSQKIFFISCDCPFVSRLTIESLCDSTQSYDIIFAKDSSKSHPIIAVWSANLLPILRDSIAKGDFRLQNIIDKAYTKALEFDKSEFFNINTQEHYATALEILREQNLRKNAKRGTLG